MKSGKWSNGLENVENECFFSSLFFFQPKIIFFSSDVLWMERYHLLRRLCPNCTVAEERRCGREGGRKERREEKRKEERVGALKE